MSSNINFNNMVSFLLILAVYPLCDDVVPAEDHTLFRSMVRKKPTNLSASSFLTKTRRSQARSLVDLVHCKAFPFNAK